MSSTDDRPVHPYIPNAAPATREAMLRAIGASSIEELYADIPAHLRMAEALDIPPALRSEAELVRHVEGLLSRNTSTREILSFLGAGCYPHHVPAVCDEVNSRAEFLTAYAGEPYEDHGRFQALFEYASMMGELLEMDVVNVPTYDGFQASATALRMAARITGRSSVLVTAAIGPDELSKIRGYLAPDIDVELATFEDVTGEMDVDALRATVGERAAAVLVKTPSYLGVVETQVEEIVSIAHGAGALVVASVDPSTLGVLRPPAAWGADIACGDIQPLGMHQHFGGGHAGFIATQDDPRFVAEFPSRLFGITSTRVEGEYGFGDVAYERTSFAVREEGKEWVGTAAALWGITAGVYLALMGPRGMVELGEGMMARTRYAIERLGAIPGLRAPFAPSHHVKELVIDVAGTGRSAAEVLAGLLERGILGGVDLSASFPGLGQPVLVCVTEVHTKADVDRLVDALAEVTR
ncbi:MAG TPA: aminomethyl-transferring glycine dehydrogenase subunit GcvPA [Actinomycetota bacterium]|nr:aminomethyl-transferring glycine dehydrogenase subunit GcvPA [Actinomycetota bacterium]